MALEYTLDFTAHLAQKDCPRLNEVQTLLNCSVVNLPPGNMILQQQTGKFTLRVHNGEKGKALENTTVKYFLPGDREGKHPVSIKIIKKQQRPHYTNPKYVNIWGTYASEIGSFINNEQLTKIFSEYGSIIEPVQDVVDLSQNIWSIDKKNFRIDLNKQKSIPRQCPVEYTTKEGKVLKATLRITYKDQPYFCKRCIEEHAGDCPVWLEGKKRMKEIKAQKEQETKTLIIGDSNLKQVNSNALLADVVASSGAKIGHVCNQLQHEKLEAYQNIVIFAGINNIPGPNENVDEPAVWSQIEKEMHAMEKQLAPQVEKGKTILLTQVTQAPHTRSPRNATLRTKINNEYVNMAKRLKKTNSKSKVDIINWGIMSEGRDDGTVKAIGEQSTIEFLQKVDQKLGSQKLRAQYLDTKLTAYQYSQVTTTYPLGCYKCTAMKHTKEDCPADFSRKRIASQDLMEDQAKKTKATSVNAES